MSIPLHRALLILLGGVLLLALVPAAVVLDRTLAAALEEEALDGLRVAPMVLEDRNRARSEALNMHAMEVARVEGLAGALSSGEWGRAVELVARAARFPGEQPLLVGPDGRTLLGPDPSPDLLTSARRGQTVVGWSFGSEGAHAVALAPVTGEDGWRGAVGVAAPMDEAAATTLAGLTRSEVVILRPDGTLAASTAEQEIAEVVAAGTDSPTSDGAVRSLDFGDAGTYWAVTAPLGGGGRVVFLRSRQEELAVLPRIRRGAVLGGGLALVLALGIGVLIARSISRPVRSLAGAAERLAEGDFDVPLLRSSIREVDRMSDSFADMRRALQERIRELREANEELEDRQERLKSLQAELIQRDRLVASGRLVAELAHEIRNPVANVRNCLEVIDRRLEDDAEGRRFTEMAIDELLRMHELAEQMLDLNRPAEPDSRTCDAGQVARQAAALFRAGRSEGSWTIEVTGARSAPARISPDALKQVLMNLVENAREAMGEGGTVRIHVSAADPGGSGSEGIVAVDVVDEGPGVPEEIRARIFDPFFTTKGSVRGVGLGLSVAEGIVRRHGGRLSVEEGPGGRGARFRVELLEAGTDDGDEATGAEKPDRVAGDPAGGDTG
ncbi:MAG: HAMP domain-containing sensor histidine kinase [Longimicrobiales bacterium]|nr:HAMP domain-containing sensor histidine kinase [Longimicrobiales bacterium]